MNFLNSFNRARLGELARTTWQRTMEDAILNRAAELAFWFLLGFFPMFLSVVSVVTLVTPGHGSNGVLMNYIASVLPSSASGLVGKVLGQTTGGSRLWLTLLFALWSSSSAMGGVMTTLNTINGVQEGRSWWKARLLSLTLALATGVLLSSALVIVIYGPELMSHLVPNGINATFWSVAQWPAAIVLLIGALLCLYRFAPDLKRRRWSKLVPGSIFAAVLWIAASLIFKVYVRHVSNFGIMYGSLGTLVVLMMWFYLSGIALLMGGELNSAIQGVTDQQRKRSK